MKRSDFNKVVTHCLALRGLLAVASCTEIDAIIVRAFNDMELPQQLNKTFPVSDYMGNISQLPILTPHEVITGKNVGKLDLVKEYKGRTGCNLMDAKRACEQWFEAKGMLFKGGIR